MDAERPVEAGQGSREGRPCRPVSKRQKVRWELHTRPFLTPGRWEDPRDGGWGCAWQRSWAQRVWAQARGRDLKVP